MIAVAFDTLWALAALGAALPVIALFLLKRKRRDVPVSSSMLWQRAMKETVARSPFRKPSEWLSLLLMLAALVAAALGAAGMRLGSGGGGRALVLVLDVSASMATRHEGVARIDTARAKAAEALDALKEGDRVTLVAAGEPPRVLAHATTDIAAVRRLLDDVQAQPTGCDVGAALALALAEGRDGAEVVVLSDFCHEPKSWSELPPTQTPLTLVRCGEPAPNVGITQVAVSADEGGVSLLARVGGEGARTLSLYVDGALRDAREVKCAGEELAVVFSLAQMPEDAEVHLRATLKLEPADDLALDDVAHVAIGRTEPPRILHVGAPDPFIQRLESAVPGLLVVNAPANATEFEGSYDLAIVTEPVAQAPPARRELYIGCTPPGLEVKQAGEIAQPELADWDSTHPLLRGVGLENLLFLKAARIEAPQHALPLVRMREGPLLLELRGDGRETYTWACGLNDSNLVLRPAFPVLIRNLLGAAIHRVQGRTTARGTDLPFGAPGRATGEHELALTLPGGERRSARLLAGESYTLRAPHSEGFITAEMDGAVGDVIGTGLYRADETGLKPLDPTPAAQAPVEIVSASAWVLERPVWKWCAAAAALLLLLELVLWLAQNRAPARARA
ncbi:MAG: VWA domain-containing protein [Planctomycetes bacterium]|nr:VWA domain-containing protein [Planctomycetota bacterium]